MILGQDLQDVINKLIRDFAKNPSNPRYASPFPLSTSEYSKQKVWFFFWAPIEQYTISLNCHEHDQPYRPLQWTSDFVNDKRKYNPRLLFCLSKNVVLVQRFYRCAATRNFCVYMSASKEFMDLLPSNVSSRFEFKLYHRSGYSFQLLDFLFQMVASGNNFQQISESIANLKVAESLRNDTIENILQDVLVSFPSASKLETVFLDIFYSRKTFYEDAVTKIIPENFLVVDHTFKVADNVGGLPKNLKKLVKDGNLFVVLDGRCRIVAWKLTSTVDNTELQETLECLGKRLPSNLTYVITDNCCVNRDYYQGIFDQNLLIKQDVVQFVQRVSKSFSPDDNKKITKDFGLVFRATGDLSWSRNKPTPDKETMIENLNNFLETNRLYLSTMDPDQLVKMNEQLSDVAHHINQDCLSNISPGHGSENLSRLYRLLNRSLRG